VRRQPQIEKKRLWSTLETHSKIGATPEGGLCREALTEADREGRDLFALWCRDAGMDVRVDALGNMFALRSGTDDSLPPVGMGSHLDTQPSGGRFDGVLGVLGGLEVVRALNDADLVTRRPIVLINWTNEEGSRFVPSMIGSGVYAGLFDAGTMLAQQDSEGVRLEDALEAIGYAGTEPVGSPKLHAFIELHIEQGPILEQRGMDVGVVIASQGMSWNEVTIIGRTAHAGTTPMKLRLDPMMAASRLIVRAFERAHHTSAACTTIGSIRTTPASHSTVPKTVTFLLDVRHPEDEVLEELLHAFDNDADQERSRGFSVDRGEFGGAAGKPFDPTCVNNIRAAVTEAGYSHCDIISGAGHDAVYVNGVCPTGMIFVPCKGGVSHHPSESITAEQAFKGADVLLRTMLRLAS